MPGGWWRRRRRDVNRQVLAAAERRQLFVNAVDDPAHATAYLGGVVRRDGVTIAISTDGRAPALAGLLREALDAWLPADLDDVDGGGRRGAPRRGSDDGVPMERAAAHAARDAEPAVRRKEASSPKSNSDSQRSDAELELKLALGGRGGRWSAPVLAIRSCGRFARCGASKKPIWCSTTRSSMPTRCGALTRRAVFLRRQARRPRQRQAGDDQSADDSRGAAGQTRGPAEGRRPVRVRPGRGRGAGAGAMPGFPFEVVPGVTTAVAAPELAGIPVTHRGMASGFLVLAGQTGEALEQRAGCRATGRASRWSSMMGLGGRDEHRAASSSRTAGRRIRQPRSCAARRRRDEWTWTGRLADLGVACTARRGSRASWSSAKSCQVREALAAANRTSGRCSRRGEVWP